MYEPFRAAQLAALYAGAMITRRIFCGGALAFAAAPLQAQTALTPERFGARGDGMGDDAPAIQRALAAGRTVQLRAGARYRLGAPLRLSSGATLVGGTGTTLLPLDASAIIVDGASDVRIENLAIVGQRQRYRRSDSNGVFIDWRRRGGSNVTIDRVSVRDVAGGGIIALAGPGSRSRGLVVDGCLVDSVGAHGIIAQDYIDDVLFQGNEVRATSLMVADRPGITASRNGSGVIVRNNRCFGSPNALGRSVHGISLDTCSNAECSGNVLQGWTHGYGIEIGGAHGATVVGNEVRDGRYGIALSGSAGHFDNERILIESNNILRMSGTGIYSFMANGPSYHRNVTLRHNTVRQVTGRDIGIGVFLTHIDGLELTDLDVRECSKSGVSLIDCVNFNLSGVRSIGNNLAGDPAHAGLAIRWLRTPARARGANHVSGNDISGNWRERNLVYFDR
jgi:hypothetical protein